MLTFLLAILEIALELTNLGYLGSGWLDKIFGL